MSKHENVLSTIGRTPVVRLTKFEPPGVRLYAKVEAFNPGGSVKDRLALGVIEAAEPFHPAIRVMDQADVGVFSLSSIPTALADAAECAARAGLRAARQANDRMWKGLEVFRKGKRVMPTPS